MSYLVNPYMVAPSIQDVGGWKEIGRTTLGSSAVSISVASLPNKPYLMVMTSGETDQTNADHSYRYAGDVGANYDERYYYNGGSSMGTRTGQTFITPLGTTANQPFFDWSIVSHTGSGQNENLVEGHAIQSQGSGAGALITDNEYTGKHSTSSVIDEVEALTTQSGGGVFDYLSGSEVVVLGYDPADADTGGFWEELANVDFTATADTYDTGAFDAKKYLFFQGWVKGSALTELCLRVNGDVGSNYTLRRNNDGTGCSFTSQAFFKCNASGASNVDITYMYGYACQVEGETTLDRMFIMQQNGGEGATGAPRRATSAGKWASTDPITSLQFFNNSTGDFTEGKIAVWGND